MGIDLGTGWRIPREQGYLQSKGLIRKPKAPSLSPQRTATLGVVESGRPESTAEIVPRKSFSHDTVILVSFNSHDLNLKLVSPL